MDFGTEIWPEPWQQYDENLRNLFSDHATIHKIKLLASTTLFSSGTMEWLCSGSAEPEPKHNTSFTNRNQFYIFHILLRAMCPVTCSTSCFGILYTHATATECYHQLCTCYYQLCTCFHCSVHDAVCCSVARYHGTTAVPFFYGTSTVAFTVLFSTAMPQVPARYLPVLDTQ